jgi:GT2 family glycosyltransferase
MQWLRTKPIAVVSTPKQESLAACWNSGVGAFFDIGSEEVLVINNDVGLPPYFYNTLKPAAHIFHFATGVSVNDPMQVPEDPPKDSNIRPHPDFSAFMITPYVTGHVGWFNADYYPAYCEDCDYHVRMHRAGITAVCMDLPFYHAAAQTVNKAQQGERERIQRGADINREKFRATYGCYPGTKEYESLFLPSQASGS